MEPSIFIPCYNEQSASLIRVEFPGGHQSDHLERNGVSLRIRQRVSRSSGADWTYRPWWFARGSSRRNVAERMAWAGFDMLTSDN